MSYFQTKASAKPLGASTEPRVDTLPAAAKPAQQVVSTLGPGMVITGNIVCNGAMQIFGRVTGDIHASRLVVCDGAQVEGKIVAQEAVIEGTFKGTIHGNAVKLQATAVVDGEIFNKSLTIEQNAQFEGVARRLDKAVDMPAKKEPSLETPIALSAAQVIEPAPAAAPLRPYPYGSNGVERFTV